MREYYSATYEQFHLIDMLSNTKALVCKFTEVAYNKNLY